MADFPPGLGGSPIGGGPTTTPDNPQVPGALSFSTLVNSLINIGRNLSGIQQAITSSFINLSGSNVFTGTNTFTIPPIIAAGGGSATLDPAGAISSQVPAGGVGTGANTTEDTLFTYTLPASSLNTNGRGVDIFTFGKFAANGNNKTVKLYFGGTSYSSGVLSLSGASWFVRSRVYRVGSNSQSGYFEGQFGSTIIAPTVFAATETDTSGIVIKTTGQNGSISANDIVAYGQIVNFWN